MGSFYEIWADLGRFGLIWADLGCFGLVWAGLDWFGKEFRNFLHLLLNHFEYIAFILDLSKRQDLHIK